MKTFNLYLLLLVGLTLSCTAQKKHHLSFKSTTELQSFLNAKNTSYPLLSAHRGGPMPGFPENCIATFANATTLQPVIIEFDVALSKDSVLVILHDNKLDRTTTGSGPVENYTYKELQSLHLKDNDGKLTDYKIPTLGEVLRWGKNKVLFTIDIKRGVPYEMIIAEIRKTKSESNSIVITYNAGQAAAFHQLAPDLMISASLKGKADLDRLNKMGVPDNRIVAFVGVAEPDKTVYAYLNSKGIACILGTMGNLDRSAAANPQRKVFYHLIANGAAFLSTDQLQQAGKELDDYRKDKGLKTKFVTKK